MSQYSDIGLRMERLSLVSSRLLRCREKDCFKRCLTVCGNCLKVDPFVTCHCICGHQNIQRLVYFGVDANSLPSILVLIN